MRISKTASFSAAAIAAVVVTTSAGAQRTPSRASRDVMTMDVAGVRLGMPIGQATAALEGAGYRCRDNGMREMSHADRVADEVDKRRGQAKFFKANSAVAEMKCEGRAGEQMRIMFAQPAAGPVVDQVNLYMPGDRFAATDVARQVAAKYGSPTVKTTSGGLWCDPGYRCIGGTAFSEGPYVQSTFGENANIIAFRGNRAEEAEDAAVMAEADRIAPKSSKPAF